MGKKYRLSGYTSGRQKPLGKDGPDWYGHCYKHDKTAWATRKAARRAAKKRHPGELKSPYQCQYTQGWHYGTANYPRDIYRGVTSGTEDGRGEVDPLRDQQEQQGKFHGSEEAPGIPDHEVR